MRHIHILFLMASMLFRLPRAVKFLLALCADAFAVIGAYIFAYLLRVDGFPHVWLGSGGYTILLYLVPSSLLFCFFCKTYCITIRYLSFRAFIPLAISSVASSIFLYVFSELLGLSMPRSIPFIYGLLLFSFCTFIRFFIYNLYLSNLYSKKFSKAIIYGAGESGRQLAKALQIGDRIVPVAFVDDDNSLQGKTIYGIMVYSPSQIPLIKKHYDVQKILFAIPSVTPNRRKVILNSMMVYNLEMLSLPGISELASGITEKTELQEVSLEDLLGRDPIQPIPSLLYKHIKGHNVLVTGAGGSVGSELCRQIVGGGAHQLILFEISEIALYSITKELQGLYPQAETILIPILGNIQDKKRVTEIFTTFSVQTVYHAAAYKHVPLVEYNNIVAVENNVFGTLACIEAAIESSVEHVVFISTDKAVRPTNLMGATKRLAEMILQTHASIRPNLDVSMVRFGNVLGSSGSVVPLFKRQIADGGPITVTHPEITRYFMTIPEAVQLVIQAGSMGNHGEIFVLDMGQPVKIAEMAEKMIRLSGLRVFDDTTGEGDIRIHYTGLRPGEKLYEELLICGEFVATQHPRIMQKHEGSLSLDALLNLLGELKQACECGDVEKIHALCHLPEVAFSSEHGVKDLVWTGKLTPEEQNTISL